MSGSMISTRSMPPRNAFDLDRDVRVEADTGWREGRCDIVGTQGLAIVEPHVGAKLEFDCLGIDDIPRGRQRRLQFAAIAEIGFHQRVINRVDDPQADIRVFAGGIDTGRHGLNRDLQIVRHGTAGHKKHHGGNAREQSILQHGFFSQLQVYAESRQQLLT
ncbi:hypothetical protein N7E02_02760 (plasmid) [Aliirhizobium terrae]|nr:hypothetical protein [Rhizobium sp. CC-CFT758]WJH37742.1 hypothetical protein N7E02_02760 [Rhizobium sp. CC-CFT758]